MRQQFNHQYSLRGGTNGGPHVPVVELNQLPGSLRMRGLLFQISIKSWSATRQDKDGTKAAQQKTGAQAGTGHYAKYLIDPKALKAVKTADGEIRTYVRENSLPWDTGRVLVPTVTHAKFTQDLRGLTGAREAHVKAFCAGYPVYVSEAQAALGGLFKAWEYPELGKIAERFSLQSQFLPIPDQADFRVDLPPLDLAEMRNDLSRDVTRRFAQAHEHVWARVLASVRRMADKLAVPIGKDGAIFHDTMVMDLRELCDIVPGLNLAQDPSLNAALAAIKETLAGQNPDSLRESPAKRRDVQAQAQKLLDAFGGGHVSQDQDSTNTTGDE